MDGRHRLYGDLAHLWPLMSPPDHYQAEAHYWLRELRSRLAPGKRRILTWVPEAATTSTN